MLQEYPDADQAFVHVYGSSASHANQVSVEQKGSTKEIVAVTVNGASERLLCEIEVPIKYGKWW